MSSLKKKLANLKSSYQDSKNVYDTQFGGVKIPGGDYIAQLQKCELKEAKSTGKLMIQRQHIILSGDFPGCVVWDYLHLETPMGFVFARKWIDQMGYTAPDDPEEIEALVEEISKEKSRVKINLKNSGDFTNITVIELLDNEGDETPTSKEDPTSEEAGEEEAGEEEAGEEEGDSELELLFNLRQFVIAYELDGFEEAETSDEEMLKEMILSYPWKQEEMEAEEIELFKLAGIDDKIIKPKVNKKPAPKKIPEQVTENIENMTKLELEAMMRNHGVELDRRKTKTSLVAKAKAVLAKG